MSKPPKYTQKNQPTKEFISETMDQTTDQNTHKIIPNMIQETNNKDRFIGLTPTPISAILPNQSTDPNSFLTENVQNVNQFRFNANDVLSKGIVNNNIVVNPKNPREYGLYLDRKEFNLSMPLYPNIADNVVSENVSEYVVIIDSSDRNLSLYPNPFKLKAFFNQSDDATKLNIPRAFENVKFLRIENVILPRNYFLAKYSISGLSLDTIANINADPIIPSEDKSAVITALGEILSNTTNGDDAPSPLTTPTINTVKIINLKLYSYTVTITTGNKVGVYTIVYPNDTTYTSALYTKTLVSGASLIDYDLDTFLQNTNYNIVTNIGGQKKAVSGDNDILFQLNSITRTQNIDKFMIDNNIATRRCYEFTTTFGDSTGILDFYFFSNKSLDGDRYVMLSIDEITDNNINSTNNSLRKAFCLLYPDSYGELHYYAASNYQDKIYKMSNLGNINRLTLTLSDSYGRELQMPYLDLHVNNSKACFCNNDNYGCPCSYIRHPYYKWLQVQYMIKLGVVETEIDKKIFY
jgi:hypothetical protein